MNAAADQSVAGADDRWMLFERQTPEGYPLVVLARTGNPLVDEALRKAIITIVRCEADISLVNDRGMPMQTDRLYPVEEVLARKLDAFDVGAFHVASVTGDGLRRIVFAHASPLEFNPILTVFDIDGYVLSAANVDDRAAWIALVSPTDIDRQLDGDRGVILNLEENGDDGLAPRKTDFWFYGERDALENVAADLGPWGYSVDRWLSDPAGVVLTTEMPVDFGTFSEVTPVLIATADRHGVTYDGWETFVVGHTQSHPEPKAERQSCLAKLFGGKN